MKENVSTHETDCDGDNATASDSNSETGGGWHYEAKNGQIWKHLIVVGQPGLTAYSENISSLAETLNFFITEDIPNEIRHHTNAEGSSRIPDLWKDISSEQICAFLGLCIVSGILRTCKEPVAYL
jgi:hypothetical protein